MKGDFTRFTHDPTKHYSRVLRQQGRVDLDADWNEAMDLHTDLRRVRTRDVVGPTGAPRRDAGFGVTYTETDGEPDLALTPGRMYVDGVLATLDAPATYRTQPDLDPVPPLDPRDGARHLVYLDVWERHVTAHDDAELREPALGGLDTTTRVRTMAQVRWTEAPDDADCADSWESWERLAAPTRVGLHSRGTPAPVQDDPCLVQPRLGYHGLENRLYRVEIHDGGHPYPWPHDQVSSTTATPAGARTVKLGDELGPWRVGDAVELYSDGGGDGVLTHVEDVSSDGLTITVAAELDAAIDRARRVATWKWSRDNGHPLFPVASFSDLDPRTVELTRLGRDHDLTLRRGDWVELVSGPTELHRAPGTLARVEDVRAATRTVTLDRPVDHHRGQDGVRLRRWDQLRAPLPVDLRSDAPGDDYLPLEDGVEVRFDATDGGLLRSGDWWAFTARTSGTPGDPGTVQDLAGAPPRGRRRLARLAVVQWRSDGSDGWDPVVHDCRRIFSSLTDLDSPCPVTSVGDGRDSIGRHTHDDGHPHGIQQAIDSLERGVVHVLPGRYELPEPLRLHDGVTLQGCGDRTVLVAAPGQPAVWTAGGGRTMHDVAVETLRVEAASSHGAVRLERIRGARVTACTVAPPDGTAPGPGLVVRDCDDAALADSHVRGEPAVHLHARAARVATNRLRGTVHVADASRHVVVAGNNVSDGQGIRLGGTPPLPGPAGRTLPDEPLHHVRVEDNHVHHIDGAAVHAVAESSDGCHDLVLSGNHCTGCVTAAAPPATRAAVHLRHWSRVRIHDNHVTDNGRERSDRDIAGVLLSRCRDVDLHDNRIARNGQPDHGHGLVLAHCEDVGAAHNRIHGWGRIEDVAEHAPARVAASLHGTRIHLHGNRVSGGAIQVRTGSAHVRVEDNHVGDADGPGIHLGGEALGASVPLLPTLGKTALFRTQQVEEYQHVEKAHVMEVQVKEAQVNEAQVKEADIQEADIQEAEPVRFNLQKVEPVPVLVPSIDHATIAGNTIHDVRGNGIEAPAHTQDLVVRGNHVTGCARADHDGLFLGAVVVQSASRPRILDNVVGDYGAGLSSNTLAGISLEDCHDAQASGNQVDGPGTALRATYVNDVRVLDNRLRARTALALRVTDATVRGNHCAGLVHLRDGSHRVSLDDNDVRGTVLVGGLLQGIDDPAHAVGVHDATLSRNVVHDALGPGIETADPSRSPHPGGAWNLHVHDNTIVGCLRARPTGHDAALVLDGVHHARVHRNHVRDNGRHATVGVLALDCVGLDLDGNDVRDNGVAEPDGPQAGVVALRCLPAAGEATHALRVHDNTVSCPVGPALVATGLGSASVQGNRFTSHGIHDGPATDPAPVGACVSLWFLDHDPLPAQWLAGTHVNVGYQREHHLHTNDRTRARRTVDARDAFPVDAQPPPVQGVPVAAEDDRGRVLVQDNQVLLRAAGVHVDATLSAFAGADVAVQDNQVTTEIPGGSVRCAVLTHAAATRVTNNRVTELPWGAHWSAFTMAHQRIMTGNQFTHCHFPGNSGYRTSYVYLNLVSVTDRCTLGTDPLANASEDDRNAAHALERRARVGWTTHMAATRQAAARRRERWARVQEALRSNAPQGVPDRQTLLQRIQAADDADGALDARIDRTLEHLEWMTLPHRDDAWNIAGRIHAANGADTAGLRVRLAPQRGGRANGWESTVDAHGHFHMTVDEELSGSYALQVSDPGGNILYTARASSYFVAGKRDLYELVIPDL